MKFTSIGWFFSTNLKTNRIYSGKLYVKQCGILSPNIEIIFVKLVKDYEIAQPRIFRVFASSSHFRYVLSNLETRSHKKDLS